MADDLKVFTDLSGAMDMGIKNDVEILDLPDDVPENIDMASGESELPDGDTRETNDVIPEDIERDPPSLAERFQNKIEEIVQRDDLSIEQKKDFLRDIQAQLLDIQAAGAGTTDETAEDSGPILTLKRRGPTVDPSAADIHPASDIEDWLGDINPNFDPFDTESPYSNNCGSCALAVFDRLNGDTEACATAENIGYNDEMNALTGMEQVPMSPEEIESRLLAEGEGAHAIIGIDRAEGPGHWFNAACVDGKVVAIDGQSGEVTDWPPDYGDVVNWEMSIKREG